MDRQARSKMNTQIYEEACTWFVESRAGDLDEAGRREFDRWFRKSPEHLSAYLEIAAIWHEGPSLDSRNQWTTDALIELALESDADNVVSLPSGNAAAESAVPVEGDSRVESAQEPPVLGGRQLAVRKAWFTGSRRLAIAASIAVLTILAGAVEFLAFSSPIYATALDEQRSIQFEDGSTVELNSRSKIRVKYSKQERDVELIEGQALFHVAHDVTRPFIVAVGTTRVRAVGTQFDVYKKSNGTVVTVVEGRVALYSAPTGLSLRSAGEAPTLPAPIAKSGASSARKSSDLPSSTPSSASEAAQSAQQSSLMVGLTAASSFLLAAGEQVTVTADTARKTPNPNIRGATAWRDREIVFDSATLSDVAEEFNRYNERQLVIKDPALYGFHISGVFSSTDPNSLIKFLQQRPGVKVTEAGGEIRVERAMP